MQFCPIALPSTAGGSQLVSKPVEDDPEPLSEPDDDSVPVAPDSLPNDVEPVSGSVVVAGSLVLVPGVVSEVLIVDVGSDDVLPADSELAPDPEGLPSSLHAAVANAMNVRNRPCRMVPSITGQPEARGCESRPGSRMLARR